MVVNSFHTLTSNYQDIIDAITNAGGRFIFVGGCVRDILLGIDVKDVDAEVFNLPEPTLFKILSQANTLSLVGKSFGVIKVAGRHLDISLPREDKKIAPGHRGFHVTTRIDLDFSTAARRRDLTINSMGYDPLTEEILDPFNGQEDLERKILRATDPETFGEDPLRALRVAQFAARFNMLPDEELYEILKQQDLRSLSASRICEEFYKLLVKGEHPSLGFIVLEEAKLLQYFPSLEIFHQSTSFWDKMLNVVDHAAQHIAHRDEEWNLMLAVVCFGLHQVEYGKIQTVYPLFHIPKLAGLFLMQLEVAKSVKRAALKLMGYAHLPSLWATKPMTEAALRFVAADLYKEGLTLHQLAWVAHQWGCAHTFKFLEAARQADALDPTKIKPCVQGKHLMEIGLRPGLEFKKILDECFKIQLEKGIYNPYKILEQR
jgi:tRNA nucleotidyltransferase (CCA-adding enzyme)